MHWQPAIGSWVVISSSLHATHTKQEEGYACPDVPPRSITPLSRRWIERKVVQIKEEEEEEDSVRKRIKKKNKRGQRVEVNVFVQNVKRGADKSDENEVLLGNLG